MNALYNGLIKREHVFYVTNPYFIKPYIDLSQNIKRKKHLLKKYSVVVSNNNHIHFVHFFLLNGVINILFNLFL